ncbi:retrovirus-related pol polyprotein from transposon TNT 1-94 [Tanacetum coccineum]
MDYLISLTYSTHQSSTPLSITLPSNDYQSSVHHNVYSPSSSIPQLEYAPTVNQQPEFSQPDSGLIVPVFQKGDDPIDAINHMMSFLTVVVTSRYPTTNNQLRNSSNPRQQATINNGRVTVQPIQGRQTSLAAGTTRTYTPGASGSNSGKQRTVICYNCKGEGHMSKQCTKPKRKRDDSWFKDKVLLVQAQASGQILHEEELAFLADPGIPEGQATQTVITINTAFQDYVIWIAYRLCCDELNTTKAMPFSELSNVVNHSETKITSDSNIIPYTHSASLEPKLYDGNVIKNTSAILIPDSEETVMLAKENHSVNSPEPTLSSRPTKVEVLKELPKVSMVNTSLKKLNIILLVLTWLSKKETTPTTITEGSWGFEHTKACFRDEIIPFVKALKDLFNTFDQYLIDELSEVQNVFHQMEQAVEQHLVSKDIVNTVVNSSMNIASVNVNECEKCLKLETKLLNKKDFIEKEIYDKLFKSFTTLEKHCISLEVDTQLNQEIFQRDNSVSNQSAPSFDQLFELNELKAQSQEKDTVIKKLKERIKALSGKKNEDKIKQELEEIETINIELDHRVTKLIAENEHLKQTYKQLYDSIKPARIRSKEQCDDLINQVNLKSVEISDLNASLQEKVLVITALKNNLRKLKGKDLVDNYVTKHPSDPEMLKIDVEPITPKLLNKQTAYSAYIKHTQEEATVLRDLVEHV